MTDLHTRVSTLERKDIRRDGEIHEINTKIGHIEEQMDDLKVIAKSNTDANQKTNETLTDIHLFLMESKGFIKAIAWIIGSVGALVTISTIIMKLNGS